jgi:radical SAM-linked protein
MIFAAPLSIGTESVCEFMDIRLVDDISPELLMARLNENMTDEMQVLDAYYTEEKLTELRWLEYDFIVCTDNASDSLAEECERALLSDSVTVEKKTKPGEPTVTTNIAPMIKSARATYRDGIIYINAVLSADPSSFLNPEYIIRALRDSVGILKNPRLTEESYSIMRCGAYREDMTEFR